jgi:hypothetical protein
MPCRRGAVDIASTSETEDPGSNPDRVYVCMVFMENIAMLLCIFDYICFVSVSKMRHKDNGQNHF